MRRLALILVLTAAFAQAQPPARTNDLKAFAGMWAASLNNSTEEVPFGLEIKVDGDKINAAVLNGPERWPFSSAKFENGELKLRFDQYDGTLTLRVAKPDRNTLSGRLPLGRLEGSYERPYSKGTVTYPLRAIETGTNPAYVGEVFPHGSMQGDWDLTFESSQRNEKAPATFRESKPKIRRVSFPMSKYSKLPLLVTGTIIPVSGDYGLLAGTLFDTKEGTGFRLARFDGIHVILMKGEILKDGTLKGLIESGKTGRTPFTGVRKEVAAKEKTESVPDALTLTKVKDPSEPFRFSAPEFESGKAVSASDPQFKDKVVIVDIMGTWCPNCHDEEPALVELWKKYHAQGLEIVSLAYEYTNDPAQNKKQIAVYKKRYNADGQLFLIAGTTDEGEIARTLPQLDGFGAYPTTIFVGRDGRVKQIHAGYDGPATGARFDAVKKSMEQTVVELLAQPGN